MGIANVTNGVSVWSLPSVTRYVVMRVSKTSGLTKNEFEKRFIRTRKYTRNQYPTLKNARRSN